jgi:hypothetical protein
LRFRQAKIDFQMLDTATVRGVKTVNRNAPAGSDVQDLECRMQGQRAGDAIVD